MQRLILSGEPAGSIPATKELIEDQWGAKAGDTAGMTEVGTIIMFECDHQPGGAHLIEDHYLEEVIDPESGEPVGYGELGERVVTSFGRGFIPVLRYRTGDLVCRVPGRPLRLRAHLRHLRRRHPRPRRRHEGDPRHQHLPAGDRGDRPPPWPTIEEFQVRLYTAEGIRDEVEVLVEATAGRAARSRRSWPSSAAELAEAHEGLRIGVRRVGGR